MEQEEVQADGLNLVPILLCVNSRHDQAAELYCLTRNLMVAALVNGDVRDVRPLNTVQAIPATSLVE
jgi:hypothetical protein